MLYKRRVGGRGVILLISLTLKQGPEIVLTKIHHNQQLSRLSFLGTLALQTIAQHATLYGSYNAQRQLP